MNCPNCQNPIQNGEKFCGKCGSPLSAIPSPNIVEMLPQKTGPKKATIIMIGAVLLSAAVIMAVAWYSIQKKNRPLSEQDDRGPQKDISDVSSQPTENVSETASKAPASTQTSAQPLSVKFSGTEFFYDQDTGAVEKFGATIYEFYPEGETADTWKQSLTIFRRVGKNVTPEDAKKLFEGMMKALTAKGAFVSDKSEIGNAQFGIFSFVNQNSAMVTIDKTFLYKNEIISIDYSVRFGAKDEKEAKEKSTYHLIAMKLIQKQFDATKFPFPWEK